MIAERIFNPFIIAQLILGLGVIRPRLKAIPQSQISKENSRQKFQANKTGNGILDGVQSILEIMAPRLSRPPDPQDPAYQRLENRINFGVHCALFAAVNSGTWFGRNILAADWNWTVFMTAIWLTVIMGHGIWLVSYQKVLNLKIEEKYGKLR